MLILPRQCPHGVVLCTLLIDLGSVTRCTSTIYSAAVVRSRDWSSSMTRMSFCSAVVTYPSALPPKRNVINAFVIRAEFTACIFHFANASLRAVRIRSSRHCSIVDVSSILGKAPVGHTRRPKTKRRSCFCRQSGFPQSKLLFEIQTCHFRYLGRIK